MQIRPFPDYDKIDEMIKKKITFTNGIQFQRYHSFNTHHRNKTSQIPKKPTQNKQQNDIVIMNMPPSNRIDFSQNDFQPITKKNFAPQQKHNRMPFFTNPQIFSEIQRFQSYMFCESHLNKQNCHHNGINNQMGIKKYNSVNIKFSYDGKSKALSQALQNAPSKFKGQMSQRLIAKSSSVPIIEFKPSFRQLLKRNVKSPSKIEIKLKKSQFNYQRAISTSCESRKKAFMKILNAFEENCVKKMHQNPQLQIAKPQEQAKSIVFKLKNSRQLISRVRTSRKSSQKKERSGKQEDGCRPWSAGKKNQIKLQPTEEQNPLQFYSINAKY